MEYYINNVVPLWIKTEEFYIKHMRQLSDGMPV